MPTTTFSTLRDLLRYAVTRFNRANLFFGHGTQNALDEAAYLILHTLSLPLEQLEPFLDARLLPSEIEAVSKVIEQRVVERLPAAYITQQAWLGSYAFYVDQRVIVPRSFIAELIPEQLAPWISEPDAVTDILELCTGSGCLAILLAEAFPAAQIDAVDLSADALAVAQRNLDDYQLNHRISLIEADLYQSLPPKKYDLIIANPPYVNAASMARLPAEYQHEPALALAGGADGMTLVRRIVADAKKFLQPDGVLMVEIGNERAHAETAFAELDLTWVTTSAGDDMVFLLHAADLPD